MCVLSNAPKKLIVGQPYADALVYNCLFKVLTDDRVGFNSLVNKLNPKMLKRLRIRLKNASNYVVVIISRRL